MSTDDARTPTEIDQIAETWVTTPAELDPAVATWIGIPGKLDEYEDLSEGHAKAPAARGVLAKLESAAAVDDVVDWVTKTDLTNELTRSRSGCRGPVDARRQRDRVTGPGHPGLRPDADGDRGQLGGYRRPSLQSAEGRRTATSRRCARHRQRRGRPRSGRCAR